MGMVMLLLLLLLIQTYILHHHHHPRNLPPPLPLRPFLSQRPPNSRDAAPVKGVRLQQHDPADQGSDSSHNNPNVTDVRGKDGIRTVVFCSDRHSAFGQSNAGVEPRDGGVGVYGTDVLREAMIQNERAVLQETGRRQSLESWNDRDGESEKTSIPRQKDRETTETEIPLRYHQEDRRDGPEWAEHQHEGPYISDQQHRTETVKDIKSAEITKCDEKESSNDKESVVGDKKDQTKRSESKEFTGSMEENREDVETQINKHEHEKAGSECNGYQTAHQANTKESTKFEASHLKDERNHKASTESEETLETRKTGSKQYSKYEELNLTLEEDTIENHDRAEADAGNQHQISDPTDHRRSDTRQAASDKSNREASRSPQPQTSPHSDHVHSGPGRSPETNSRHTFKVLRKRKGEVKQVDSHTQTSGHNTDT